MPELPRPRAAIFYRHTRILQLGYHLIAGFSAALVLGLALKATLESSGLSISTVQASPYGDPAWIETNALLHQYPCGQDGETALSRGCVFELATGTWQLPECTNQQQEEGFRRTRSWKFYAYTNRTLGETHPAVDGIHDRQNLREIPVDELQHLDSDFQVWTTWEFHLYRCAWLWKRDVLAANRQLTGQIGQRQHCVDEALMKEERFKLDDVVAGYRVRFLSCSSPPHFVV
ncbi:hypothetical protein C8035_v005419 [Colletotrichum spinosum]|uniref:Uncharacterized protein n=1 Tax=Colletotrichum spinosum TaxID=1347390 RepID=A0A4R8QQK2_9PEZI|nr:hypothetical protein C8035_v005419 [Colletotrichum spinosum]